MQPDTPTRPAPTDPRRWVVLGVMCLSLLLIVMDNTIVNVAIPTLQRDLDASTSQLQWVVDSYILVFAGLLLTMGALGDRFGRRGALAILVQRLLSLLQILFCVLKLKLCKLGDALVLLLVEFVFGGVCSGVTARHPSGGCDHGRHLCCEMLFSHSRQAGE